VLVEGYMDVIGAYAADVREVVASCGTALTNPQVRAIHRHADTVVVNFDPDDAGGNAAERAIQLLLDESLHVRVLTLEGGLDPDEYVKQNGAEAYRARLDAAPGYFHWLADRARARFDMRSADGRMDAFKFLLPAVQRISDKLERAAVANDIAGYLGVDPGLVLDQFKKAATERRGALPDAARSHPRVEIPALERILVQALVSSDETRREILPRLPQPITAHFATHEIFEALTQMGPAPLSFTALDARLDEPARALLHEILAADEIGDDAACLAHAEACLRRLGADFRRRQMDEVRSRVKSAERDGDIEEVVRWTGELMRLDGG